MKLFFPLLKREPKRPLDVPKIRSAGVEMSALAISHLRIQEELSDIYARLGEELTLADPTSQEGKDFEQLFIELNRIHQRVSCCHAFIKLADRLQHFRIIDECRSPAAETAGMAAVEAAS